MELGWIDFSKTERSKILSVLDLLSESGTLDELGIAPVRDGFSNLFFPGTTSDSTGAVTGNILGAYLGLSGIPEKYLKNLELKNVILELADDLFNDCKITEYGSYHDEIWEQKYIYKSYRPKR